jgi:hypothetical protein
MRYQHATLAGGPVENGGIGRLHEANILHADKLKLGVSAQ